MGVKLMNEDVPRGIWVGDMEDGDIAVIVDWIPYVYIERIIQRYKDSFISIGYCSDGVWSDKFSEGACVLSSNCRVRVLEKGETLVIT